MEKWWHVATHRLVLVLYLSDLEGSTKFKLLHSCSATESPAVFATEVTTSSSCEVLRTKLTMMYSRSEPCRWFGGYRGLLGKTTCTTAPLVGNITGGEGSQLPNGESLGATSPTQSGLQSMDSAHQDGLRVGANVPLQPATGHSGPTS